MQSVLGVDADVHYPKFGQLLQGTCMHGGPVLYVLVSLEEPQAGMALTGRVLCIEGEQLLLVCCSVLC